MDVSKQAVTGLIPPQLAEAIIREVRPSVTHVPGLSTLAEKLMKTYILAPLAWLLLAPLYFKKILPIIAQRYTITNRRVMIQRGMLPKPVQEVPLADIEDVRIEKDSYHPFYRSGTLEILVKGQVAMRLCGVPEPESFRRTILQAHQAWKPKSS